MVNADGYFYGIFYFLEVFPVLSGKQVKIVRPDRDSWDFLKFHRPS